MKTSVALLSIFLIPLGAIADRKPCGGFAGLPCPEGYKCVDDPRDNCDPKKGGADCIGYCVKKQKRQACGGLKGLPCSTGYKCVDNPHDGCDPKKGGVDCIGYCVKSKPVVVTKLVAETATKRCKHQTICVDYINKCGQTYGGCYDTCTPTTFTPPPCPTTKHCKHRTICVDYVNECGKKYGGCYDTCTPTTFTPPPCPTTSTTTTNPEPTFQRCGGYPPPTGPDKCPRGQRCVDDPRDGCDPKKSGADCPGICIPRPAVCNSKIPCGKPDACVDNPSDNCDFSITDECPGICVKGQKCKGTLMQVMKEGQCDDGYTCIYKKGTPPTGCALCKGVCARIQPAPL